MIFCFSWVNFKWEYNNWSWDSIDKWIEGNFYWYFYLYFKWNGGGNICVDFRIRYRIILWINRRFYKEEKRKYWK